MIRFLLKGLIRDRSRSLLPAVVVSIGVMVTVMMYCWIIGSLYEMIDNSARFETGHVKVMTRAYQEVADQIPNDLAILNVTGLRDSLAAVYPDYDWVPRIRFGGLLDIPDENGETRDQGPVIGMAADIITPDSRDRTFLNLAQALVTGDLPQAADELLISAAFAAKLGVGIGDPATLIGSTMHGGMAFYNFKIVGTVEFGILALDRGALIADIRGVQDALDMPDGASELLGLHKSGQYLREEAPLMAAEFN